jgi:carbonic anhydrase/acetyltransferase-like protein (isoleucine patch superfamily)
MPAYEKIRSYLYRYGFLALVLKGLWKILYIPSLLLQVARKVVFYFHTRCWVKHIIGHVYLQGIANDVKIGKDATIYPGTVLEIAPDARLRIGDHFVFSYGALIACRYAVSIGHDVMVGEYTSIRDTTHVYDSNSKQPYVCQPDRSASIEIASNVWIGRGCIILPGTIIEKGVIIGANSVVKGHLKAYWLYGGVPARAIRSLRQYNNSVSIIDIDHTELSSSSEQDNRVLQDSPV